MQVRHHADALVGRALTHHFRQLWIQRFRCFTAARLEPAPGLNLIHGDNGAGKTSLLEAIYLLGRGQSFRPSASRELIQEGQSDCLIRAELLSPGPRMLAIRKSAEGTELRLGQESQPRLSDLVRQCPTLVMEPGQHRLLEDGPRLRRRYLDWSVFHVEPGYQASWIRFQKALRQRNALLRQSNAAALNAWDLEYQRAAEAIDQQRQAVFLSLQSQIESALLGCFGETPPIQLQYFRGWNREQTLGELLEKGRATDRGAGFTLLGPHRAEIRVRQDRQLARRRLSRGQQKLLVAAMVLAQAEHLRRHRDLAPVLLLDDLESELASSAQQRLWSQLLEYPGQCFVTSLEPTKARRNKAQRVFHVKHGAVSAVL